MQSTGESVDKDKVEYLKKEDERLLREDLGKHRESVNIFNQDKKISMDNFDIIKILGRGAFGKVMLVEKKENKKLYALKVMRKDQIIQQGQVTNIINERKILLQNKHPNLVNLEFAFQTDAKLFLGMPFYQGGELFVHLQK